MLHIAAFSCKQNCGECMMVVEDILFKQNQTSADVIII